MFVDSVSGAQASTVSPAVQPHAQPNTPPHDRPDNGEFETVRHLLFGSLTAVQRTIHELHNKQYAEPNDWSQPISTGRPNEVMAILTRRVRVD